MYVIVTLHHWGGGGGATMEFNGVFIFIQSQIDTFWFSMD